MLVSVSQILVAVVLASANLALGAPTSNELAAPAGMGHIEAYSGFDA
ncbi:hypothetical protein BB8028_0005g04490 [Beauveria bassiana]|uniref:Uncharacterized protein n=1 Tax=Beauveria bassiana TaxID=176275 RepID=A0A2S7YFF9_BEABA|nr:hypothetical protein BB8028_0005g04490 [Beauveria bassiana]